LHEFGIARDLVNAALAAAKADGATRVMLMHILLGPDGDYVDEPLRFSIKAASRGTPAEGTSITIESVPTGGVVLSSVEVA